MTYKNTIIKVALSAIFMIGSPYIASGHTAGYDYKDVCHYGHQGCVRGCESINNQYYVAQCHGACGTGLLECRNGY